MAVAVTVAGSAVTLGKPTPLFHLPADAGGWGSNWSADADPHEVRRCRSAARDVPEISRPDELAGGR